MKHKKLLMLMIAGGSGDTATVVFTDSIWEYLPDGTSFTFSRD